MQVCGGDAAGLQSRIQFHNGRIPDHRRREQHVGHGCDFYFVSGEISGDVEYVSLRVPSTWDLVSAPMSRQPSRLRSFQT